jgi:hypothetical protein
MTRSVLLAREAEEPGHAHGCALLERIVWMTPVLQQRVGLAEPTDHSMHAMHQQHGPKNRPAEARTSRRSKCFGQGSNLSVSSAR